MFYAMHNGRFKSIKWLTLLSFFIFLIGVNPLGAQGAGSSDRAQIAVMDLQAKGLDIMAVTALSDRMRVELFNTGKFTVLERGQMDVILQEQGFQQTGVCSESDCIVEMGQLLGVDRMVAGSVGKLGNVYIVTVRLIDMESGRIVTTKSVDCECPLQELTKAIKNAAMLLAGQEAETSIVSAKFAAPEGSAKAVAAAAIPPKKGGLGTIILVSALLLGGAGAGAAYALGVFEKEEEVSGPTILPPPPVPSRSSQ